MGKILEITSRFNSRPLEPVRAGYETEYPACSVNRLTVIFYLVGIIIHKFGQSRHSSVGVDSRSIILK